MLHVGRPGEAFGVSQHGEAFGLCPGRLGEFGDPQAVECGKNNVLTVGRRTGAPDLCDAKRLVVDRVVEEGERPEVLLDMRRERDFGRLTRGHTHAHDLAAIAGDQRTGVRGPRPARIDVTVTCTSSLRVVSLDVHHQPLLLTGLQVTQLERGARIVARSVDQPAPVRTGHRAERALVLVRPNEDAAGLAIEHPDLVAPELAGRGTWPVLGPEAGIPRLRHQPVIVVRIPCKSLVCGGALPSPHRSRVEPESRCAPDEAVRGESTAEVAAQIQPDVAVVRSEGRAEVGGRRRCPFGAVACDLNSGSTIDVVQPLLSAFGRHHVRAVRRPYGRHVVLPLSVGQLMCVRPVGIRDPEVFRSVTVTDEDDPASVGRIPGLHVVSLAARDARRVSSRGRDGVQVPQEFEEDRALVG